MQTGPRGQREWKFYETVQHEKQAAAAASSTGVAYTASDKRPALYQG